MIVSAVGITTSVLTVIFGIFGIPTLSSIAVKVCAYLMNTQTVTAILYIEICTLRFVLSVQSQTSLKRILVKAKNFYRNFL